MAFLVSKLLNQTHTNIKQLHKNKALKYMHCTLQFLKSVICYHLEKCSHFCSCFFFGWNWQLVARQTLMRQFAICKCPVCMSRHYSFLFASCQTLLRLHRKRLKEHTNPNRSTQTHTKVFRRIHGKIVLRSDSTTITSLLFSNQDKEFFFPVV